MNSEDAETGDTVESTDDQIDDNKLNDHRQFKLKLNGTTDLEQQLMAFKAECDAHEKQNRRRRKRRFYNLGLIARVGNGTTDQELRLLLKNGVRTFLLDAVVHKPNELKAILGRLNEVMEEYQRENASVRLVTGLAIELHGDLCRVSRLRNNCSLLLPRGGVITLTTDNAYQYSGFLQIMHVMNLNYYLKKLQLNDEIKIGREVQAKIVKILNKAMAVLIVNSGIVNSFDYIELPNQCQLLDDQISMEPFENDLEIAANAKANYVLMPRIRCKRFLKILRSCLKDKFDFKLIGSIDLDYVSAKMLDLMGMIKLLDYLWIPDMFSASLQIQSYLYQDVIPIAKGRNKPIIGSVPLERCSDFKEFENHPFLFKVDSILIEKSQWCNKYPLIVKKLLPITNFRMGFVENRKTLDSIITSYQSIVNFIIRTICTIECHAILLHSKCDVAAAMLTRAEIYCPVYVILPVEEDESEDECTTNLALSLNLRRNVRTLIYTEEMNENNLSPFAYAIAYTRQAGLLETGDFYISIEVCKEDEEEVQLGNDSDIVILRASYFPAPSAG